MHPERSVEDKAKLSASEKPSGIMRKVTTSVDAAGEVAPSAAGAADTSDANKRVLSSAAETKTMALDANGKVVDVEGNGAFHQQLVADNAAFEAKGAAEIEKANAAAEARLAEAAASAASESDNAEGASSTADGAQGSKGAFMRRASTNFIQEGVEESSADDIYSNGMVPSSFIQMEEAEVTHGHGGQHPAKYLREDAMGNAQIDAGEGAGLPYANKDEVEYVEQQHEPVHVAVAGQGHTHSTASMAELGAGGEVTDMNIRRAESDHQHQAAAQHAQSNLQSGATSKAHTQLGADLDAAGGAMQLTGWFGGGSGNNDMDGDEEWDGVAGNEERQNRSGKIVAMWCVATWAFIVVYGCVIAYTIYARVNRGRRGNVSCLV